MVRMIALFMYGTHRSHLEQVSALSGAFGILVPLSLRLAYY